MNETVSPSVAPGWLASQSSHGCYSLIVCPFDIATDFTSAPADFAARPRTAASTGSGLVATRCPGWTSN